ncbi:MAG: type II secretion system protein GspK [Kofleriaceae bacterium]
MRRLRVQRPRLVRGKLFASRERGIALVMVMIAISIILAITNQFGTNANIDMIAAANYRDQMRAHFLARTALNVSELVIRMQVELEKQFKGLDLTSYADQFMMAFCGNRAEISEALGVPVERLDGLGGDIGNCGLIPAITTDDSKINLNCAYSSNNKTFESLRDRLMSLLSFSAYDPVFDEGDAEAWRRNRETQVAALLDYVDKDSLRMRDRGSTEDYGYESLKDSYRAKQNLLDTVGELRLVRGVDDRFWTLFGKAFTVYGGCKINLQAVDNVALLASILRQAAENPTDPVLQDQQKLWLLATVIIKAQEFGQTFKDSDEFIDFVKDPAAAFSLPGQKGGPPPQIPGLPPGVKVGLALKKSELDPIVTFGARITYRVTAWGEINRAQVDDKGNPIFPPVRRTITGVWDTGKTPQHVRKEREAGKGAWVFLKEE